MHMGPVETRLETVSGIPLARVQTALSHPNLKTASRICSFSACAARSSASSSAIRACNPCQREMRVEPTAHAHRTANAPKGEA